MNCFESICFAIQSSQYMNRIFTLLVIFVIFIGCDTQKNARFIKLRGSESMHEPFAALKAAFESSQDSIKVILEGGGSRTGLMGIQNEEIDIGLSSYHFDIDSILGNDNNIKEQVVAYDGIVLINNERNPITHLTDEQVTGIFTGKYTDWAQLGGQPGKIQPIIRNKNSGTQKFFAEYFKIDQVPTNALIAEENHEIVQGVLSDQNGIGFVGYAYVTLNVKDLSISSMDNSEEQVFPSKRSILAGAYPLKRGLRIYYQSIPRPEVNVFLEFLASDKGQQTLELHGLINVPPVRLANE